ncbi:MAG: CheR family methyltransferase [Gammaproteobacteria bacterium]
MTPSQRQQTEIAQEFEFTDHHFNILRTLVNKHSGINLSDAKKQLVYGRIARRLRKLDLSGFDAYCRLLKTEPDRELPDFVNAITTNKTGFFREPHHFEFLARTAIPGLLKANADTRRIRIWSAGCSTGQEPYSIAIVLLETIPHLSQWDVKVLATDIDSNVLAKGERGVYTEEQISDISASRLKRWFRKGKGANAGQYRVSPALQSLIRFKKLNLMHDWPMRGPFDLLFCRNVVIYFDKPTQRKLFERYADILVDGGHLIIGHSESLFSVSERYQHLGQTIHQKVGSRES